MRESVVCECVLVEGRRNARIIISIGGYIERDSPMSFGDRKKKRKIDTGETKETAV